MEITGPMGITGHLEIRDLKEIAGHVEIAGRMTQGNRIYRLTPEVERLRLGPCRRKAGWFSQS
jgi:UDP-3-O-[3-hydroxymyristoyl] glucosamine N-acyltransferase